MQSCQTHKRKPGKKRREEKGREKQNSKTSSGKQLLQLNRNRKNRRRG